LHGIRKKDKVDIENISFTDISAVNTDRLIEAFARNGAFIKNISIRNVNSTSSMENYFDGTQGQIEEIELSNIALSVFDKYPHITEELLEERGKHVLRIANAEKVRLSEIRISGKLLGDYATACAEGSELSLIENCNFEIN
jgi:hypothetical protein